MLESCVPSSTPNFFSRFAFKMSAALRMRISRSGLAAIRFCLLAMSCL
jgi:hypothetical protein